MFFWERWSTEYLSSLQVRKKWLKERENLKVGDLVLLTDENKNGIPKSPLKWPLAKVIAAYTGNDNIVRVVKIRTQKGEYIRPVVKLRKLPLDSL